MVSATEARDWALYADWCHSWGRRPEHTDPDLLEQFFTELPAAPVTLQNRARAIRKELERRGYSVTLPPREPRTPPPTLIRTGEKYATTEGALAQLPRARRVTGFRGRRDAWLLILIGVLQLTRRECHQISAEHIDLSAGIRIHGRFIPTGTDPATCPACAVTRWLRVMGVYGVGFRSYAFQLLDPATALTDEHDCETPVEDDWRNAPQLLPAIDQHGWIRDAPLSLRSISAVSARVQRFSGLRELGFTPHQPTGRYKDATSGELVLAQDDVDAAAARLLERSRLLLESMDDLLV
jgi:hypothetical protein